MISKIIYSTFFVLMLFAISLSLFGITHVELGSTFMAFLRNCSRELEDFKIAIPDIPMIPMLEELEGFALILNAFIHVVNALSTIINILTTIINVIIQLLQFVIIILKNIIIMRDAFIE